MLLHAHAHLLDLNCDWLTVSKQHLRGTHGKGDLIISSVYAAMMEEPLGGVSSWPKYVTLCDHPSFFEHIAGAP